MLADNCLEVCPQTIEMIDRVWNICRRSFDTRNESIRTTGSDRSSDSRSQRTNSSPRPKRIQDNEESKEKDASPCKDSKGVEVRKSIPPPRRRFSPPPSRGSVACCYCHIKQTLWSSIHPLLRFNLSIF